MGSEAVVKAAMFADAEFSILRRFAQICPTINAGARFGQFSLIHVVQAASSYKFGQVLHTLHLPCASLTLAHIPGSIGYRSPKILSSSDPSTSREPDPSTDPTIPSSSSVSIRRAARG